MNYSRLLLAILVLCGFSFAVSLQCNVDITSCTPTSCTATGDLTATAGRNCINISTSNVVIDCDGFNITGNGTALNAFYINGTGYHNITIQNCGIYNFTRDGFNGSKGVNNLTISDSAFINNTLDGVFVLGNDTTVTGTEFYINDGYGLFITGNNAEVTENDVHNNVGIGIHVEGDSAQLTDNDFYNNFLGLYLFDSNNSAVTYNVFDGDASSCMYLETLDNTDVQRNNMSNCGYHGVEGYDLLNTEFSNNTILQPWLGGFFINIILYDANVNVDFIDNVVNESYNYTMSSAYVLHNVTDSEVTHNLAAYNNNTGFGFFGLDNVEITGNQIIYNHNSDLSQGYGVVVVDSSELLFYDNLVAHNGYDADGTDFGGMLLLGVTNSDFITNNISDNADDSTGTGSLAYGVGAYDLENVTFDNNTINNNNGTGLYISLDTYTANEGIEIEDNEFKGQQNGMIITDSPALALVMNSIEDNLAYGAWIEACNGTVIVNNGFENNTNESAAGLWIYNTGIATVADNGFFTNANGLFLSSTVGMNVTENNFVANGVGLLDFMSDTLLISDNIFNESTNSTAVLLQNSSDAVFSNNIVHNNTYGGVLIINSGPVEVADNVIRDNDMTNSFAALTILGSPNVTVSGNEIYGNYYGILTIASDNLTATQNNIYDSVGVGIWLSDSDNALLDQNTLTDNGDFELYLDDSSTANVTDNTLFTTALAPVSYGIVTNALLSSEFSGNTITGLYEMGYIIADGSALNTITSDTVSGSEVGFFVYNSTGNALVGTESYDNIVGYGLYESATATITDATSHDNTGPCLGVMSANATLDNFRMWSCGAYLDVDGDSTINATDLWLGYNEDYGVLYETIYINETTVADGTNVILNPRFVSINSTDTDVAELSVPAIVTIRPLGTCAGLAFYELAGFPQSQDEILTGGSTFTPSYQECVGGGRVAFSVTSFSGYAAAGTSPSGGRDTMIMSVSGDKVVGEELTITVMDGTTPVSGANVKVFYWRNGILNVQDLGNTNSQGKVTFTPALAGSYKATANKAGYTEEEARFIISATVTAPVCISDADCAAGTCTAGVCILGTQELPGQETPGTTPPEETAPPAQQPECTSNADCAYNEACSAGSCVLVPAGACGEYTNHAWVGFNCCADADCGVGFACTNHNCVQSGPRETEVPGGVASMPGSTPPTGETPWALVGLAVLIGAAIIWWLFVRKP